MTKIVLNVNLQENVKSVKTNILSFKVNVSLVMLKIVKLVLLKTFVKLVLKKMSIMT